VRPWRSDAQSAPSRSKVSPDAGADRFQIMSNLSHELRGPLHVINGYLDILAEDWAAELSAEPSRILERLRLSAAELAQTVENLLEYAAAAAGTAAAVRETVEVSELLAELEPAFGASARRKKIFLVWRVEPQLALTNTDRRRLVSIVNNLINNAIKFTDRGGVTVQLRRVRVRGERLVELEVADTGIGMSQSRLEDAFAPFVQLSSSNSRERRGLGLGLSLVRRNVIALGASLEVKSKLSLGSRFRVRFQEGMRT
jgi:signal transduction histidine kinase